MYIYLIFYHLNCLNYSHSILNGFQKNKIIKNIEKMTLDFCKYIRNFGTLIQLSVYKQLASIP